MVTGITAYKRKMCIRDRSMIQPNYDLVEEKRAGISVENNPNIVADTIVRFSRMDRCV